MYQAMLETRTHQAVMECDLRGESEREDLVDVVVRIVEQSDIEDLVEAVEIVDVDLALDLTIGGRNLETTLVWVFVWLLASRS